MKKAEISVVLALMLISCIPCQSIMDFKFKINGTGSTTTTYSYLREPRLQETGFAVGLKTGSFNYLEGGNVNLTESINYVYGNGTDKSKSSASHTLDVNFRGNRSISEFYAKGFFWNNRWISAWKKIYYEESPWTSKNRSSKNVDVNARVEMATTDGMYYNFDYYADIDDGKFEGKDSTGWTNRSGARRYDWEYAVLSTGDTLKINNTLSDSAPFPAAAGAYDWIPCCFDGTRPDIEGRDEGWPTLPVIATLQADTVLPNRTLKAGNCSPGVIYCPKTKANLTCEENDCPGFSCIYEFDKGPTPTPGLVGKVGKTKNIDVDLKGFELNNSSTTRFVVSGKEEQAKYEIYRILVHNNGDVRLEDVEVFGKLAKGMKVEFTRYYEETRGRPEVDVAPYRDNIETELTWYIGTIAPEEPVAILLGVHLKPEVDKKAVSVRVTGKATDGTVVEDSKIEADILPLTCETSGGQPCICGVHGDCTPKPPDWAKP